MLANNLKKLLEVSQLQVGITLKNFQRNTTNENKLNQLELHLLGEKNNTNNAIANILRSYSSFAYTRRQYVLKFRYLKD